MKRGDFVALVRRPEFRGMVVDVWDLAGSQSGTVFWENGHTSTASFGRDTLPAKPFVTPALRKRLLAQRRADLRAVAKVQERIAWVTAFLKVSR